MKELLTNLGDMLQAFWDFFTGILESLGLAYQYLQTSIPFFATITGFVPSLVAGALTAYVAIMVCRFLLLK